MRVNKPDGGRKFQEEVFHESLLLEGQLLGVSLDPVKRRRRLGHRLPLYILQKRGREAAEETVRRREGKREKRLREIQ